MSKKLLKLILSPQPIFIHSHKRFQQLVIMVIALMVIDSVLGSISDTFEMDSNISKFSVCVIASFYIVSQFLILNYAKTKRGQGSQIIDKVSTIVDGAATIFQYFITGVFLLLLLYVIQYSYYPTVLLKILLYANYGFAILVLCLLAVKFLSWYKSKRNFVTLIYGLASFAYACSAGLALVFGYYAISSLSDERDTNSEIPPLFYEADSPIGKIQSSWGISNIVNYFLFWSGTIFLSYYLSKKIGKVKFWLIMLIPLALFLSIFVVFTPILQSMSASVENMIYIDIFGFTVPNMVSGILFGVPFVLVARTIKYSKVVKDNILLTAYGLMLSQLAGSVDITTGPYPPFLLSTALFTGLSTYLIFRGLSSSIFHLSLDAKMRREMRKIATNNSQFFGNLTEAEIVTDLEKRVSAIARKEIYAASGETGETNDLNVKGYVKEVFEEMRRHKGNEHERTP
ncbi:MAG: hypothetical protein ABJB85_09525 [Nitrososphaerota archaeon]